jgi:hypothetical protein
VLGSLGALTRRCLSKTAYSEPAVAMPSLRNRVGVNECDGGALIFCASRARFGIARLAQVPPEVSNFIQTPSANRPSLIAASLAILVTLKATRSETSLGGVDDASGLVNAVALAF